MSFLIFNRRRRVSPLDYGAVGDGVAIDQTAVAAAITAARSLSGYLYLPAGFTFAMSGYATFLNGDRGLIGDGGVLRFTGGNRGILLSGMQQSRPENVSGLVIDGARLDCNSGPAQAIYAPSITDCIIRNCRIWGITGGNAMYLPTFAAAHGAPCRNLIELNEIDADTSENPLATSILISGRLDYSPHADAASFWVATKDMTQAALTAADRNIIRRNRITGGYYGISIGAGTNSTIQENSLASNIRNISMQGRCTGNLVIDNRLSESLSSAVHMAYGSTGNRVMGNRIRTTRGRGEGLLQTYVGSGGNWIIGNHTDCPGPALGNKYHAYAAIQSSGNVYERNVHRGRAQYAYVGIESGWSGAVSNPAHRNHALGGVNDGFSGGAMSGTRIECVQVHGDSAVPAIFISQIDQGVVCDNTDNFIDGCTITGSALPVDLYQMAGALTGSGSNWPS